MKAVELAKGVYWVGAIDWNLRNFHGYSTEKGSTYNAYLVVDEKIALIDAVKAPFAEEMVARISSVIDPAKIDYIVSNHVEMDHSGAIPAIAQLAPHAKILCSANGQKGLAQHFSSLSNYQIVSSGETLSLGARTLTFVPIPMVHWPDSMVTYLNEEQILFPNDAFGQHLASEYLFDDQVGWDIVREQAAKYYANIVLPYGKNTMAALNSVKGLPLKIVAPSHGVILRSHISDLIALYEKWATYQSEERAVIVYDSMWGSTEKMAWEIKMQLDARSIPSKMISLTHTHISDAITDIMEARYVIMGSATLNNCVLPTVGALLTYLKGLRPANKISFTFGSYGWGGQAPGELQKFLQEELKWTLPLAPYRIKYLPTSETLSELRTQIDQLLNTNQQ